MTRVNVVGIDPGPVPGIVALRFIDRELVHVDVVQCNAFIAGELLDRLLDTLMPSLTGTRIETVVQLERFVVGRRSSRSSTASAGATTRDLVGSLQLTASRHGAATVLQNAGTVKPWATDARLEAAGLLDATKGMRHAKDAARHALFAAAHDSGQPDPLSKEWRTA